MQLYVLDRAKNTLATTASFYNDKHHKELTAGASIFEFTIDKSDSAAQYMTTGNYLVFLDDRGRAWSFTILSYDETQTTKTVAAEDVSIELLNKAMDVWNTNQAYPFSYYFNLVTKDTPWELGVNQLTDLSRKLVYTGRDTGLGRLLSVLKGFDNAECQFNIEISQTKPVKFTVDVYKTIGTVQDNIQLVYNNELNDIKKTESRAQFVTALSGVGGLVENQNTTDPGLEKHIDFADVAYKDDDFVSAKGDKFLRAVTANKVFNPGAASYVEDFYDYDTQSAQELLNRTLTQLKERSEPQYTYAADVKVIDPTLDIGDTVTMIDHDYQPALYLSARVATLDKSYTDPTQGAATFCNYRILNSTLSDQLRSLQNIIDQLPTSASVKIINNNITQLISDNEELEKKVVLALQSADGKSTIYYDAKPSTAQENDTAFVKNTDGVTEIWKFSEGKWILEVGVATTDQVKQVVNDVAADIATAKSDAAAGLAKANDAINQAGLIGANTADLSAIVNGLVTDVSGFESTQTDHESKISLLQQNYNGLQTTVADKADQTQVTQLVNQYTTLVKDSVTQAQLTLVKDAVNLRVQTGDLINQINLSTEGILIDGSKVHITGTTTIDDGIITTAMIGDAQINGAKIADASIMNAKIVNLDGSKIVANSITADKLDVNAIAVGLNTYGSGWQITPASIAFLPAGTDHASISLTGDMGIAYGDSATGEMLGHTYGTPYDPKAGMDWFNGISTELKYNGADFWAVLTEESDSTTRPRLTYSRSRRAELGVFQGWTFDDKTHFGTIGPMDASDYAQMKVVRVQVAGRWSTGFMNSNNNQGNTAGIVFTDDGATYLGRAGRWYNLFDIANKLGLGV